MMTGLLSVPEWSFVGLGGTVLLVILVVVGLIILRCFISAEGIKYIANYKEQ